MKTTAGCFIPRTQATTDATWIGKYSPVQVYVSEPVLNHDNHMTNGKEESSNLKRLLTDILLETNLSHIADWISSLSVAKRSPAFQHKCVGGCTPGAISDRY